MFISAEKHFLIGHSILPLAKPLVEVHVILSALRERQSFARRLNTSKEPPVSPHFGMILNEWTRLLDKWASLHP